MSYRSEAKFNVNIKVTYIFKHIFFNTENTGIGKKLNYEQISIIPC